MRYRRFLAVVALSLAGSMSAAPLPADRQKGRFELVGKLEAADPGLFRKSRASVSLQGVSLAFSASTLSDSKGQFKLKRIPAGMYILVAVLPRVSFIRRTVDIGPSFADAKSRVHLSIPFVGQPIRRPNTVSSDQLAVPEEARREHQKALQHYGRGDAKRAIELLRKVVETAPQYAQPWNTLGNISLQSQRLEEAEGYFREALNRNPNHYRALIALGGTLISLGKPKESLQIYTRALSMRPNDPDGLAGAGVSYLQLGETGKAEQTFLKVKSIEQGHYSCPQLSLAQVYAIQGKIEASIRELEEFLNLHPDSEYVPSALESLKTLRGRAVRNEK